jgi:hypothetical protein
MSKPSVVDESSKQHDALQGDDGGERRKVGQLIEALTLIKAAEVLGVSREALARYAAGIPIRRGTSLQIAVGLAMLEGEGTARGSPPADLSAAARATCRNDGTDAG